MTASARALTATAAITVKLVSKAAHKSKGGGAPFWCNDEKLTNGRHNFISFTDECASVTCLNYGDHERLPAACQCECRAGFSGDYCGTGVHPHVSDVFIDG